jgi:predicted CxxxxCH...CXXCH cytochrome family protein
MLKQMMPVGVFLFAALLLFASQSHADLACVACHGSNGPHGEGFEGCNACHGFPPRTSELGTDGLVKYPSSTGGASPGGHVKHATAEGYSYSCQTCHSGGMTAQGGINQDPRQLEIGFNIFGNEGGVYNGRTLSAPYSYTAGHGTTINLNGSMTCSTIYCHSDGTSVSTTVVPAFISPAWTSQGPLACTSCHGYPPAYTHDSPKSNTHMFQSHRKWPCSDCHYATTNDGIHITDTTKHINGQYDVVADPSVNTLIYTWDRGGGTCSNVRCHGLFHHGGTGSVVGSTPETSTSVWGDEAGRFSIDIIPGANNLEKKFSLRELQYNTFRFPGVSYSWDFGDGGTSTDAEPTHTYAAGTYTITLAMRDADYHPKSLQTPILVEPLANVLPVSAMSVSVSGNTVTVTDLSYDPDYNIDANTGNIIGNPGPGHITILWGEGTAGTGVPINLTDSPSNQVYSYTYTTQTNPVIALVVRDNKNGQAIMPPKIRLSVPEAANSYRISGKLTRDSTASSVQGIMTLKGIKWYSCAANSAGDYELIVPPGCYKVDPGVVQYPGYTFNPVESEEICGSTTGVDFTVTKP